MMKLKLQPNLTTREIRGEFVVIDARSGNYHIFNEVGKLIWRGIEAGRESSAIVDEVVSSCKVAQDRALSDFDAFVARLRGFGLLE